MPILLEEDLNMPLPNMHKVRQSFNREKLDSIEETINFEAKKESIVSIIKPGQKVAVAVGSRGIKNIQQIVKLTIDKIKEMGGEPFIVSAMGSHGGGTEKGQREVLYGYGITEEYMGVPVITKTDVMHLGKTKKGFDIYFDKVAASADVIVPINRIKLHTDFVADIQSGLCKMLVIGLGNHVGCSAIHEEEFDNFGSIIKEAASLIMEKVNVGFGVGILENAYDETAKIKFIPSKNLISREIELVKVARQNMPTLMIPEIDILIVEEIGKNISGAGYDPNILGKSYILKEYVLEVPKINKMILLDVSKESHGNAIGMGIFDIITRKVFEQLDYESIYANSIAVKCIDDCKIPLISENEDEALKIAIKVLRNADKDNLKIVKIKNTLELEYIYVSDALVDYVKKNSKLELV
ncbi:lactate racemase domain-containing protein [Clostridium malenominatum]|uniref:Lactate racemase domain-containing protein n=1 Tax=Clostridium malenominatum TaxID=1539 RepID=A0ABN1J041_9CLOT